MPTTRLLTPSLLLLLVGPSIAAAAEDRTQWVSGKIDDALRLAGETERLALVYCWEEKEERSVQFYGTLITDSVMTAMEQWVCFSAKRGTPEGDEAIERFSVRSVPAVLFVAPDGELEDLVGGVLPPKSFIREMERVRRGEETLRLLRERAANADDPGYLDARFALAFRYRSLGDTEAEEAELVAIEEEDPKGKTPAGARVGLLRTTQEMAAALNDRGFGYDWDGTALVFRGRMRDWSLKPLYAWAKKVKNTDGRFEAWDSIATHEWSRQETKAALAASQQAHKCVPDDRALDWCADLARKVMDLRGKRPKSQQKLALRLATDCKRRADALDPASDLYRKLFGDESKDVVVARYTEPLAYAQKYNGNHSKSIATIEKCIALDPDNKEFARTLELLKSGTWPPPPEDKR